MNAVKQGKASEMTSRSSKPPRVILLLMGLVALDVFVPNCRADNNPDPTTLLQGVEAARLQIPPSSLKIRYIYHDPFVTNQRELSVDFDTERRRFLTDPKSGSDDRSVFDGSQAIVFNKSNGQAELRNLNDPNLSLLFDPRLLGITHYYFWHESIETAIPYRRAVKVEMVGREKIGDKLTWHVRLMMDLATKVQIDIWIDDTEGFRVFRYDRNGMQTLSFYENKNYPWLPNRVLGKEYNSKGGLTTQLECHILDAKAKVKLPESTWTIAGLQLPVRTPVVDIRTKQNIGYWNGQDTSSLPDSPRRSDPGRLKYLVLIMIAFPLALLLIKRFRLRP